MSGELVVAIVATVIAAGALVLSVIAFRQNRKLADRSDGIQDRLAAVEEARRLDELRPALGMTATRDGGGITLTICNDGGLDLEHVQLLAAVQAPQVIKRGVRSLVGTFYPLRMGASEAMSVAFDPNEDGGQLVLRLRLKTAVDEWEQTVRCDVPDSKDMDLILRQAYIKQKLRSPAEVSDEPTP